MQTYGANAWKIHNYLVEDTAKGLEKALEQLKERNTEVNRERKQFQVRFWPYYLLLIINDII